MGFAYLDKYKMLHVVDEKRLADQYTSGKVVTTSLPNNAGYFTDSNGNHIRIDVDDKSYRIGKTHITEKEFIQKFPEINKVIQQLV